MNLETIQTYNQISQEYDNETAGFWDAFPNTIIQNFIENTKGRVLDVGSGPGRDGLILEDHGLEIVCLDASRSMVELTRQKGLISILADFNKMPVADSSFDGVWAYTSLIHTPKTELPQALLEIKRVLRLGGTFGIGVIEGDTEGYTHSSGINLPRYFAYYSIVELAGILDGHGFDVFYFEQFKPKSRNYLNFLAKNVD